MEELDQQEERLRRGLDRASDERQIGPKLTNKSFLQVIVYEGRNISSGLTLSLQTYLNVALIGTGQAQDTHTITGYSNPKWNEEMKFDVPQENLCLKVEGFARGLIGMSSIGAVKINLRDLENMKPLANWFDLCDENGQKTGYFLDQKLNRVAAAQFCKGKKVLDTFTHTGAFGLNAFKNGAKQVISVDISPEAVEMVNHNIKLNKAENIPVFITLTSEQLTTASVLIASSNILSIFLMRSLTSLLFITSLSHNISVSSFSASIFIFSYKQLLGIFIARSILLK